jgi:hydroxyacylglutathione hydrolase
MSATALPAFEDNYIWMLPCSAGQVVVDPGDARPVLAFLQARGETLHAILITHHHWDHAGGIADLVAAWPQVRVIGPRDARIPGIREHVGAGDTVELGTDLHFAVLDTSGHTVPHIAYFNAQQLFCGDTLFSLGCGRLFEGTPAQMHASLSRLGALGPALAVHCAHEYTVANARFALAVDPDNPRIHARMTMAQALRTQGLPTLPSRMAEELACNPFLRAHEPVVAAAAEAHAGRTLGSAVEVFAVLRAWKDGFR